MAVPSGGPAAPSARDDGVADRFINRELSWLDFNARVVALAEDASRPLLERAKFLAIFSSNLDEFFEVRIAGLVQQLSAGLRPRSPDGLDPLETIRVTREQVRTLVERQTTAFTKDVAPQLEETGIRFLDWDDLDAPDRAELQRTFEELVYPVLTPLAVDPAHPFPYISNLSLNLAVAVRDPESGVQRFARVKVPPILPRFVPLRDGCRFVPLEQVIAANLGRLFPGMEILDHVPFRVTRDADFELDDEDEDLLEAIESVLYRRTKFGHTVRLEVDASMSEEVLDVLCRELEIPRDAVVSVDGPLDLTGLFDIYALDRPDLKDEPWIPQTPATLAPVGDEPPDFFGLLRSGDLLVHHPYDSFATSVEAFVDQAAEDPAVLAIKQTIYRGAGPESAIVTALVDAARQGKQVVALVELKARFDEQANIERARVLEEAGVHVVYGLVGLKTHCKILLVVRQEEDGVRRYCHVGTGNYNAQTAKLYEDLGLLSADPALGADLTELFNHLTGYSRSVRYRRLLVAPENLRPEVRDLIRGEAAKGSGGRIVMKMNSLVDPELIDELYAASAAGTDVDLIVRGICCLRPQQPGLSERIRVRSIVGGFLEHSRVYRFGADPTEATYLIGSADLMPRNLDRRVESLCPVESPALRARLDELLTVCLADDVLAWELTADGVWNKVETLVGFDAQVRLRELAVERAQPRVTVVEREIKLAAPPANALPPLSDPLAGVVAEPEHTEQLLAIYYDTDDLRLTRAGASLRHRSDEGWAVKLPRAVVGNGRLDRATYAFRGDAEAPPPEALELVRALARSASVGPVAQLRTRRRAVRLHTTAGTPIGEVVDDDVTVLGPEGSMTGFRELEFELADEAPDAQAASIVARLRASGAGPPDPTPKIVRALGPRAAEPPDVAAPPDEAHTVGDVVRAALAGPVTRLVGHDPGVRRGDDPEDVHQARVATRRLRSHLRTFGPLVDETWAQALRDELGWLGGALGAVRDADVLLERLEARVEQLPGTDRHAADRLLDRLRIERDQARDELLTTLRSPRYVVLLDRLVDAARQPRLLVRPDGASDADVLRGVVRDAWEHLADAVDALPEHPDDEALHAIRKRAKRARYAAEAVEPVFGKPARALARSITEVQDVLGEHQDAVVASDWLRRAAADLHDEGAAFAAGELVAGERHAVAAGRAAWTATWRHTARKKHRAWL